MENANCAYGENGEIPYQAGDGYIVCKHLYGTNLRISALSMKAKDRRGVGKRAEAAESANCQSDPQLYL